MYLPKADIYGLLKTLPYNIEQTHPEKFNKLPCIIFKIDDNTPSLDLDKNITKQDIVIVIDIWGEGSSKTSNILAEVEELFRQNNIFMTWSGDIPNVANIYHIQARFKMIK